MSSRKDRNFFEAVNYESLCLRHWANVYVSGGDVSSWGNLYFVTVGSTAGFVLNATAKMEEIMFEIMHLRAVILWAGMYATGKLCCPMLFQFLQGKAV